MSDCKIKLKEITNLKIQLSDDQVQKILLQDECEIYNNRFTYPNWPPNKNNYIGLKYAKTTNTRRAKY